MYYCYILQSEKSGRFYIGHAADILVRLSEHNTGKDMATRSKGPWKIVHSEEFSSRFDAAKRERKIKSWKSAILIRKLISDQD